MARAFLVLCVVAVISYMACAGVSGGLKFLPEPESDTVMVLGTVLIENINMPFGFTSWGLPMKVVLVGKTKDGTVNHYTVTTDSYGYYCLPNLPQGQYVLKAVIFQESGTKPEIIVNDWTASNSRFKLMSHPERGIEYTAEWFPKDADSRIINKHIIWFGLKASLLQGVSRDYIGEVLTVRSKDALKTKRFWNEGYPFSREEPLTFFENKFPESGWWKL